MRPSEGPCSNDLCVVGKIVGMEERPFHVIDGRAYVLYEVAEPKV